MNHTKSLLLISLSSFIIGSLLLTSCGEVEQTIVEAPTFETPDSILQQRFHKLNLDEDNVEVEFIKFYREEKRFKCPEELAEQIAKDIKEARYYYEKTKI